jgi:hypothetical protein
MPWTEGQTLAEKEKTKIASRDVHVGEVCRIGFVDIVIAFAQGRPCTVNSGEKETFWAQLVDSDRGEEESSQKRPDKSKLCIIR